MSTTAFGLGSKYFALYEVAGVGIQWHTFSQSPVEGDDFNLLLSMMMLIIDAVVYGVLTWYIEAVHPGTCGKSTTGALSHWGCCRFLPVLSPVFSPVNQIQHSVPLWSPVCVLLGAPAHMPSPTGNSPVPDSLLGGLQSCFGWS